MAISTKNESGSIGCTMVFLAPFLIAGLGALGKGIYTVFDKREFTEEIIAMLGVGFVFTLVGGGLILAVFWGAKRKKELEKLKAQYPDAPWLWRKDWASGRVNSSTPAGVAVYWFMGIVFSGMSVIILANLDEILRKGLIAYTVFLFPIVGFSMLLAAIYATLRSYKFGKVGCDLLTNPGIIGGWFRAVIWAPVNVGPGDAVETQLTCFHCYTSGSGKNRTAHRNVKWQETLNVGHEHLATEGDGSVAIPIRFFVPRACTPSTPGAPTSRYEWELKAKAAVSGIDFLIEFIVPVFVTEDSSDKKPDPAELDAYTSASLPQWKPSIDVIEQVDSLEFYARPRRSWSVVFSITLFTTIWTGIIVVMLYSGEVPLLFPIVFGFFDLLLIATALWIWFGSARLYFEHGSAHIDKSILGIGSRSVVPIADITGVDAHITMQSGATPYYTIRIHTGKQRKHTVGGIRNKAEAMDIVNRIEALLLHSIS